MGKVRYGEICLGKQVQKQMKHGEEDGSRCTRYGYVEGRRSGPGNANGKRRKIG